MKLNRLLAANWLDWEGLARAGSIYINDVQVGVAEIEDFSIEYKHPAKVEFSKYSSTLQDFFVSSYEALLKSNPDPLSVINSQVGRYMFKNGFLLTVNTTQYVIYDNSIKHEPNSSWKSE